MDIFDNKTLLTKDRKMLEQTRIPIVTVAGSWRDELARFYHVDEYFGKKEDEVLFSRAHYSMALAAAMGAWKTHVDPGKAWLVDPTNYVTHQDWKKVTFTEGVGKAIARNSWLKQIKDLIDSRVRQKLPITNAITTPLLFLFEHVQRPILSFHYESGNILGKLGKKVVQVVTDPHVRENYVEYADLPNMRFCVFDENTKFAFIEKAAVLGKEVDPKRIIITGPPVDPRVTAARKEKSALSHHNRLLRLCMTTGGLGNNKQEIEECARSLAPLLRSKKIQLIVYTGVHQDLRESIHQIARQEGVTVSEYHRTEATLRVLHSPHIVEANELLIKYAFPWADGFITKPSGDMAYDAAAAGCFLLTLAPWGEWEENIRDVFEQHEIARRALPGELGKQLEGLSELVNDKSWIDTAIDHALHLPPLFTHGIENILAQMPKN